MKEIREIIRFWEAHRDEPLALATLARARGSSYRRPGARMLIAGDGASAGSLSAGCIEEEVIDCAREVIRDGKPRLISFDTRRRFGCSGSIEIFVELAPDDVLLVLRDCLRARRSCEIATVFENSEAQDERTAAVVATHNFGRDCAALRHLVPLGMRYVGLIGPRRRRDEILIDVIDSGAAINSQLFAPAGLNLAAESPEEIALSIVAEIQSVFAGGTPEHLRDRKAPIHEAARQWAESAR